MRGRCLEELILKSAVKQIGYKLKLKLSNVGKIVFWQS